MVSMSVSYGIMDLEMNGEDKLDPTHNERRIVTAHEKR